MTTHVDAGGGIARGRVGVIVNPIAGKDIRRLVSGAAHTSDATKMGIVGRVVSAAAESGATHIVLADDPHRLARRSVERLDLPAHVVVDVVSDHVTGTRHDTVAMARRFADESIGVVVALGGDGTCRDVATGWPGAPLIAISTGTNNVYPSSVDATSAGAAAGLVATGRVALNRVARPGKRIVVDVEHGDGRAPVTAIALVDVALVDATFVGARAVRDPASIVSVVAAIGHPASTGLSSIAGRTHPLDRVTGGGVMIRLARRPHDLTIRTVRVPLCPGSFDTVAIAEIRPIDKGESVTLCGPGVLAFDGERDVPIGENAIVTITIERTGPRLIDVAETLVVAAAGRAFDVPAITERSQVHAR
jgi:ATP-NAD kinase N-terminal domain